LNSRTAVHRPADVVTLGIPSDIDGLSRRGLIASDWKERFPHNSQPYTSTIIFVVRKTNPKHIKDWPDLTGCNITIVTPDPNTSDNGKLSFLGAYTRSHGVSAIGSRPSS
jgi:sulfate transport system substrate-binding protein